MWSTVWFSFTFFELYAYFMIYSFLGWVWESAYVCFYQREKMGESWLYQWPVLPHLRHRRTADSSGTGACFGFDFAAVSGRLCDCNRCGISHRADIGKAFPCHMVGLFPKAL